jgi:peptidoglycan/LPS O-acetylase OafA/YrhL
MSASRPSFGTVLDRYRGFGPGFDFARIFLAFNVLAWHSPLVADGGYGNFMGTGAWILDYSVLPMFFGLSGFLVAGSAQRQRLIDFGINRGLRILPALIVEIFLSALIIGPIFTAIPLTAYFTNHGFFSYFWNILGFIHYRLPGVFAANPYPEIVNLSLWTVPFEILCYLVMAVLIITGIVKRGGLLILCAIGVVALSVLLQFAAGSMAGPHFLAKGLEFYLHDGKGPNLLPCFILGAAAYSLRYSIPHDGRIAFACCVVIAFIGLVGAPDWWKNTALAFLISPVMIYLVSYVGLLKIPRLPYFHTGDYSYGIYLYAFPLQQALIVIFPSLKLWPLHLLASCLGATIFATFSWHFIEKPILKLRKNFSFVARVERERKAELETESSSSVNGTTPQEI